jgi:succinate dehydrogenase hydrophobic anchor subunit
MSADPSLARRIARIWAEHATAVLPSRRADWATAIQNEVDCIDEDGAALAWAFGAVAASYAERVRELDWLRSRWATLVLALLTGWQVVRMLFAPGLIIAYRTHAWGMEQALGSRTAGDDYHRFIHLMDITPDWLVGVWTASGLLYAAAAWRLLRNAPAAFALFALACLFWWAGAGAQHFIPDYDRVSRATFTFAHANIRRDYLIPIGQMGLLAALAAALWLRRPQERRT